MLLSNARSIRRVMESRDNCFLDALEKYQVETVLYIYREAFKEGLCFLQNKKV